MSREQKRTAMSWFLLKIPMAATFAITASYVLAYYFP
jgi:hypothetical protein